ncbi:MAG: calcium/sodium antiporter [Muribaculaceae bacterium]|nr:calcium/sodium antiporter [Muribaculaceae bacterium]
MTLVLMFLGLTLLLIGANYLVDSSVAIAKRAKISNFIIGLTIVGMGTSAPELYISTMSSIKGLGDMAVGNVLGSNICNILLILGITALISPVVIERANLRRDIPLGIIVSILLFFICSDSLIFGADYNSISLIEAVILLVGFISFLIYTFVKGKQATETEEDVAAPSFFDRLPIIAIIPLTLLSLAVLLFGGNVFLDSAVEFAKSIGMSDSVIAITIVAVGTSLPELITCIIAARKGNSQLALGNVLGSNIFNILLILGVAGTISPITLSNINYIDFSVLIVASILTFIFAFTLRRRVIDRAEGLLFVVAYIAYTAYLLMH